MIELVDPQEAFRKLSKNKKIKGKNKHENNNLEQEGKGKKRGKGREERGREEKGRGEMPSPSLFLSNKHDNSFSEQLLIGMRTECTLSTAC